MLQENPEYRELSKAVQDFATNGTPDEKLALECYFEGAINRRLLDGKWALNPEIEKQIQNNLSYARHEEIKETANKWVTSLFNIIETKLDTEFKKAETKYMQQLNEKLEAFEATGIDEMIDRKLESKEPEVEKLLLSSFPGDPVIHYSDLTKALDSQKKEGETTKMNPIKKAANILALNGVKSQRKPLKLDVFPDPVTKAKPEPKLDSFDAAFQRALKGEKTERPTVKRKAVYKPLSFEEAVTKRLKFL